MSAGAVHDTVADAFPRTAETAVGAFGTGTALTRTEASCGVSALSVLLSVARYCKYRPLVLTAVPLTGTKGDQVDPSSDVRVSI